jgi:U4/U6 small nuclear ribonucleoprotein PRP3
MTIRIDWTEEARPRAEEEVDAAEGEGDEVDAEMEGRMERRRRMEAMQEKPETLADNKCEIVWEGEVPEKSFKRFRLKNVESDREGKDSLGPGKEGIWDVAKKWQWEAID